MTAAALTSTSAEALIGFGQVRHHRLRPVSHRFAYPTYFLMLPMRRLRAAPHAALPRNRFGLISFHDRDHGDARADSLAWLDDLLLQADVTDAQGEVWLHCYPRVLGHTFKPVSFWYCHRQDGALAAVVVEVNNTFGERHCYLLHGPQLGYGREQAVAKAFHVSPFCSVSGRYRFRFLHRAAPKSTHQDSPSLVRTIACIDHDDAHGLLLRTSISGTLEVISPRSLHRAFFGLPLMTLGVIGRIHWQALRLWMQRVPWWRKPPPPSAFVTR